MNDFFSYYEILDVDEKATPEAVKSAYRSKALKYHPDRVAEHLKEKSEEIFKQIQEAYDVLSDSEKRKKYDEGLKNVKGGRTSGRQSAGSDPLLRVDRNYFKFENILPCACVSDYLVIFNDGGGALSGAITTDKPWVTVSDTAVNVADYRDITITVDALSLRPGFCDSAQIEVITDGGSEIITIEISVDASLFTLFLFYIKPFVDLYWVRMIGAILAVYFLIFCLIYFNNRSLTVNEDVRLAGKKADQEAIIKSASPLKEKIMAYKINVGENPNSTLTVTKTVFEERAEDPSSPKNNRSYREAVKDEPVKETGIFYPKTGAYYPIERARYPEFYEKCDLNKDDVVMMSELACLQDRFHRIADKYPEGDIYSVVKEFVR